MSGFLDSIVDFAGGVIDFFGSNSVGSNLAKTALLGYGMNKIQASINRDTARSVAATTNTPDPGVRLQVNPDPSHKIPVVYGSAYLGGIITDAELADSNQTLYSVFTICEKTGTKLSDSSASTFAFTTLYLNDQRIVFKADGITIDYTVDRDGNVDQSLDGLVQIRCYAGGSASTNNVAPTGYSLSSTANAWDFMPSWDSTYTMNDLIFCCVKLTYSKEKNLNRIPTFKFHITNSMTKPGDVIYDYMTNTRYGAGIADSEIYSV